MIVQIFPWVAVALALGTVVVRRRSVAIALVSAQSLVIAGVALGLAPGRSPEYLVAALVLAVKAVLISALLAMAVRRTRESRQVRAGIDPIVRIGVTLAAVLAAVVLVPSLPGLDTAAHQSSLAVICAGLATVVMRRATIVQLVGLLVAENGVALASVSIHGGMPVVIELGALFDVTLVVSVAIAFHDRIFRLLGTGDSSLLRDLHD